MYLWMRLELVSSVISSIGVKMVKCDNVIFVFIEIEIEDEFCSW